MSRIAGSKNTVRVPLSELLAKLGAGAQIEVPKSFLKGAETFLNVKFDLGDEAEVDTTPKGETKARPNVTID